VTISSKQLYLLLVILLIVGYSWVFYSSTVMQTSGSALEVCIFKKITSLPCPSCGATRSVSSILKGDFIQGIITNPMGLVISVIMLITPVWLIGDLFTEKETLHQFYLRVEKVLNKKIVFIPLIILILCNWVWNIYKNL
tara:strand:+ start:29372 stop:29788 length:417 start_codon:yes stop_codon:yes gene_type:complete